MRPIVFTFDDGVESHITKVAPFFKEHDFNATFFITSIREMWEKNHHHLLTEPGLTDRQVLELHEQGFEIGNHTLDHVANRPLKEEQVVRMEENLHEIGVPKPKTFCFPGYKYPGHEHLDSSQEILTRLGYRFARTGYSLCFSPRAHKTPSLRDKVRYHVPGNFLVFSTMIMNDWYVFDHFKKNLDNTPEGATPIVTAHGLVSTHRWENMKKAVLYAKEKGFQGIAMKDLPVVENRDVAD
jgi:peptidoglycan/xylan/chitin deacetylase (PgdA/CDA1 family)